MVEVVGIIGAEWSESRWAHGESGRGGREEDGSREEESGWGRSAALDIVLAACAIILVALTIVGAAGIVGGLGR